MHDQKNGKPVCAVSTGGIDNPYALDVGGGSGHSPPRCFPTARLMHRLSLRGESDRCEQNIHKHLLAESAAYFGFKKLIKLEKTYYLCTLIG